MNTADLVDLLRPLPRRQPIRVGSQLARLKRICEADQPCEQYLREVLVSLQSLMGATATAFWLRPLPTALPAASPEATLRHGFDCRELTSAGVEAADAAVLSEWRQTQVIARLLEEHATAVIVVPLHHADESIGAIQIVFDDPPHWERTRADYVACIGKLLQAIEPSLRRRISVPTASLQETAEQMDQLTRQLHHMQRSIRLTIERSLQGMRGQSFGSLADNQRFARLVQGLLDSHGLRVRCPECGHAAILRCSRSGRSGSGAFVFDHYIESRRTFHGGGATVPHLRVIAKPSRRAAAEV